MCLVNHSITTGRGAFTLSRWTIHVVQRFSAFVESSSLLMNQSSSGLVYWAVWAVVLVEAVKVVVVAVQANRVKDINGWDTLTPQTVYSIPPAQWDTLHRDNCYQQQSTTKQLELRSSGDYNLQTRCSSTRQRFSRSAANAFKAFNCLTVRCGAEGDCWPRKVAGRDFFVRFSVTN